MVHSVFKNRVFTAILAAFLGLFIGYRLADNSEYVPKNIVFVRDEMPNVVNIYRSSADGNERTNVIQTNVQKTHKVNESFPSSGRRKIFLDCGANVASSVTMFRETYPRGKDYLIHSFDIDERLKPFFGYYAGDKHVLHCPVALTDHDGNTTAYSETAWYPGKNTLGMDVQWGGGTIYVDDREKENIRGGGRRKLSHRRVIPSIDLSTWIKNNTKKEDYVILKMDIEGAEYRILRKMLKDGTFAWIDKFIGEYHDWEPTGDSKLQKYLIKRDVINAGFGTIDWVAEERTYGDFDKTHDKKFPIDIPGQIGRTLNYCKSRGMSTLVTLVIEVGMNSKRALKLIKTIEAYPISIPLALFVYGDFVEVFPSLVQEWSTRHTVGIRTDTPLPAGHWEMQYENAMRTSIVSAERRMIDIGLEAYYVIPPTVNSVIADVVAKRKLRLIKPTVTFPPTGRSNVDFKEYHGLRDVEKVPKALRWIDQGIKKSGGIISLESDFPDNYVIAVFLLDYLFETSGHALSDLAECLR